MKLAICGKGGSGKSTLSTLLAKCWSKKGGRALVIDSDESNYGLHQQLGMDLPESYTENFGGKNAVLGMLAQGPENMPMLFDAPLTIDDIPAQYLSEKDGILLMTPGKIETANEACACAFGVVMCQFTPMLVLGENDLLIMDMEAGIEHFGRGIDNAMDAVIMVIDPSYESLELARKVNAIAEGIGKRALFVLNKVNEENETTMRDALDGLEVVGALPLDSEISRTGLSGEELPLVEADVIEQILASVK